MARDREPQPGSAETACRRGIRLCEFGKDFCLLRRGNPDTAVANRKSKRRVVVLDFEGRDTYADVSLLGELDSVAGEIDEHLLKTQAVAA
ncbi:hypothetical protein SSPSH_002031 [Salinisphaera shabanensis E1L3A]|uniref:Uncharacterized protein n=1 Tax=Salinisphaera shabanensis E1L3A TaxID=1033802 RepID=A0ACB4V5L1_9GAMM|nr:hypothetical protein [Salinisphaera shabanensis]ERJ18954.1 hypothetical protein SSPSH_002031 [Salinisphaera shabanensis E1L3A]